GERRPLGRPGAAYRWAMGEASSPGKTPATSRHPAAGESTATSRHPAADESTAATTASPTPPPLGEGWRNAEGQHQDYHQESSTSSGSHRSSPGVSRQYLEGTYDGRSCGITCRVAAQ